LHEVLFYRGLSGKPPSFVIPYGSLSEAYMNAGKKDLAIKNYEKSVG